MVHVELKMARQQKAMLDIARVIDKNTAIMQQDIYALNCQIRALDKTDSQY